MFLIFHSIIYKVFGSLFLFVQKIYNPYMRLFRFVELRVEFEGITPPLSTPFAGTLLRGSFGYNLRKVLCIFKNRKSCTSCPVADNCLYFQIFETPAPADSPFKMDFLPHPFLISPITVKLNKESKLSFNFYLFGKYCKYSPYFIKVFERMALNGFGKNRSKPEKLRVFQNKKEIFRIGLQEFQKPEDVYFNLPEPRQANSAEIIFLTPVRIKNKGRLTYPTQFETILRNIFRRVSIISFFFEGKKLEVDFHELLKKASEVKLKEWESVKEEINRYSMRKKKRMELLGFTGKLIFEGNITPFTPWLIIGEKFHIGKNISFGFGKYSLKLN